MVLVLLGWATAADSAATATAAVRAALQVWLAGHLAAFHIPGGSFALTPLGLTLLPAALLHSATLRAGRAAAVTGKRAVTTLASTVTATYAVLAVAVAMLARTESVRPGPVSVFAGAALVAGLASATAAVRATGRWLVLWHRLPALARVAVPAAALATAVLLGGGALLVMGMLAHNHGQGGALVASIDAGAGGSVLLVLGCLLYLPNAAVWAASFAAGPGFAVGSDTSVTVAGADLGPVPAVPLLAALPQDGGGGAAWLVTILPVVAGLAAAFAVRRQAARPAPPVPYPMTGWRAVLAAAGAAGLGAGLLVGLLAGAAAGAAGPGRMGTAGPHWWAVGPAVAAEVAGVAALALLAVRLRGRP
jgi:hypothetical protein